MLWGDSNELDHLVRLILVSIKREKEELKNIK
jgi:hypothetical protein